MASSPHLTVLLVGGPTAVLEFAGLRLLTDPTFDPPGNRADPRRPRGRPLHFEGWAHFTQGSAELREAFEAVGIGDRLVVPERGARVSV